VSRLLLVDDLLLGSLKKMVSEVFLLLFLKDILLIKQKLLILDILLIDDFLSRKVFLWYSASSYFST